MYTIYIYIYNEMGGALIVGRSECMALGGNLAQVSAVTFI